MGSAMELSLREGLASQKCAAKSGSDPDFLFSGALDPLLDPQQRRHRLGVRDPAVADHADGFGKRHHKSLQELAGVQAAFPQGQLPREEQLDRLVRIRDGGMDHAQARPLAGGVTRFLQQLALGGGELRLPGVDLARRDLDEIARMRIAELALEENRAVVEQRDDRHGAGMADVFARRLAAVGQPRHVAMNLEEHAVVDDLPGDEVLGQVFLQSLSCSAWMASRLRPTNGCGTMPKISTARPFADMRTRTPRLPPNATVSCGSSKYISLTMRR